MSKQKSAKNSDQIEDNGSESSLYLDDIALGISERRIRPLRQKVPSQTRRKRTNSAASKLSERRNVPPKLRFVGPHVGPLIGKWTNSRNSSNEVGDLSHSLEETRSPSGSNASIGSCTSSIKPRPIKPSQLKIVSSPAELSKSLQKPQPPQKTPAHPESSPKKSAESANLTKIKVEFEETPIAIKEDPVNLRNTIKQEPTEPIVDLAALFKDLPDFENTEFLAAPSEKSSEIGESLGILLRNLSGNDGQGSRRNEKGRAEANLACASGEHPKNENLESLVDMDNIESAPKPAKKRPGRPRKDQQTDKGQLRQKDAKKQKPVEKISTAQRLENARRLKAKNKELVANFKAKRTRLSQASKNSDRSDDIQVLEVTFVPTDSQTRLVEDIAKSQSVVDEREVEKTKKQMPFWIKKRDRNRCKITGRFSPKTPTISAETVENLEKEPQGTRKVKEEPEFQSTSTPEIEILSEHPPKRRGIVPGRGVFRLRKPVEESTTPINAFTVLQNAIAFRIAQEIPPEGSAHLVQCNVNEIAGCSSSPDPSKLSVRTRGRPRKAGNPENSKNLTAHPEKSTIAENEKIGDTAQKSEGFPLVNIHTTTGRPKNFVEMPSKPSYPEVLYPPGEWKRCSVCPRSLPPFILAPFEKHELLQWSYRLGKNLMRKREAVFVCRQHFCSDAEQRNGAPPNIENPLFEVPNCLENTRRMRVQGRKGIEWDELLVEVKKFENWKEILEKYEKLKGNQPVLLKNTRNEVSKDELSASAIFKKLFMNIPSPETTKSDEESLIEPSRLRPGLAQALVAKPEVLEKMPTRERRILEAHLKTTEQEEEARRMAKQLDEWTESSILMPENVAINEKVGTSGIIRKKQKIAPKSTWKENYLARIRENKKKQIEVINLERHEAQNESVEILPEAKILENRKRKRKEAVVMDDDEDIVVIRYESLQESEESRKNAIETLTSTSIEEILNVQVKDWVTGVKTPRV